MASRNLVERIHVAAERWPAHPAQRYWDGTVWRDRSYQELWDAVQRTARGLLALGVSAGDRVGLLSATRPEWVIADLAILCCDAVTVPIYPSVPKEQVSYIIEDAGIHWVIAENAVQAAKVPADTVRIMIEPDVPDARSFSSLGAKDGPPLMPQNGRDDLATLVYTSGTTGLPKGVQLTHGNILADIEDVESVLGKVPGGEVTPDDVALSFLPLSHILERMTHLFFLGRGTLVAYARSTDKLPEDLVAIRPTLTVSVPRVFEKIYTRVLTNVNGYPAWRRRVFHWGVALAEARYERLVAAAPVPGWMDQAYRLLDRLVFRKIREAVGGRLRLVISGGAPLAPEIGRFFFGVGVPVLEGYGLTETSPVLAVNVPPVPRYGTVGRPLPAVEIAIAEDGEILARGPNVSPGYWNRPEETEEAFGDGWFHTGDVGRLTEEGLLQVTDRKKYLLVLSTGKNVAPQLVEQKLTLSPLIEQAVVLGNQRKYVTALLYLDPSAVAAWAKQTGKGGTAYGTLLQDPDLMAYAMGEVERCAVGLAPFERPKQIRLLPKPLSQEDGDLTPSLKVKLPIVEAKYKALIEAMYADGSASASGGGGPEIMSRAHWMPQVLLAVVTGVVLALLIRYAH